MWYAFICVASLIHACDMTHVYVQHDSLLLRPFSLPLAFQHNHHMCDIIQVCEIITKRDEAAGEANKIWPPTLEVTQTYYYCVCVSIVSAAHAAAQTETLPTLEGT